MSSPDTQNDTSELREQIVRDIETAAVWREHIGALKGESMHPDRIKDRRTGSERVADLVMEKVEALIAQREQAARIDELEQIPASVIRMGHSYLVERLAFLQATKPEKGEN